jgi:membrane protease subunit (stomatin/prohibitin family)
MGDEECHQYPGCRTTGRHASERTATFNFKVNDYVALIDKIAGVKDQYVVEDIKIRITSILDQLLMKWITKEGKDMFNLQANAFDIAKGIKEDLDMEIVQRRRDGYRL